MRAEEGEEVDLENALAGLILCVCTYYRGDCCTTSSKPWCFALFTICINPHVSSRHAGLSFFSIKGMSFQCLEDHSPVKVLEVRKQREGIETMSEKLSEDCKVWLWSKRFCSESVFVAGPSGLAPLVRYSCRDRGTASHSQNWDLNRRLLLLVLKATS